MTKDNFPDLNVPFHSRWTHFLAGGFNRLEFFNAFLSSKEKLLSQIDFVIVSVFLDAGAGMKWKYLESKSGKIFSKSEGLAIASLDMFQKGLFSSDTSNPYRVDSEKLAKINLKDLEIGFQVSSENPLVGLEGRLHLLRKLADCGPRPSVVVDKFLSENAVSAPLVLRGVLEKFGSIFSHRHFLGSVCLGDVWPHSALGPLDSTRSLVPFHKLSQWLTYSLLEPLMDYGLQVTDISQLTGLAEYRNGGLFLDGGVLKPKQPESLKAQLPVDSEWIVEWRALTICLLDEVGSRLRKILHLNETTFPLVKALEGGTWKAGRLLAKESRVDGGSPINVLSDGTVF